MSAHARERASQRFLDVIKVVLALVDAELVEDYITTPGRAPDCLVLCWVEDRPVHAVVAVLSNEQILVVTVYEPAEREWTDDFKKRI